MNTEEHLLGVGEINLHPALAFRLRSLRELNNFSVEEVAGYLHISIAQVQCWEEGTESMDLFTLQQVAALHDIDVGDLLMCG